MAKRALLVGIDDYDNISPLSGCINDATAMKELLERNEDGTKNYDCRILTSSDVEPVTRKFLRQQWIELFENFKEDILFYFSGHGTPTDVGGYLVTQDGESDDPGLSMNDLLTLANRSQAQSVLLILDCCFSGDIGNPPNLQSGVNNFENQAQLREGVTILTASRNNQVATEIGNHGVFTYLVLTALRGGAADIRGNISAAAIYAYAEQALGSWDQRPMYKSHANKLDPVRKCNPCVEDVVLRKLTEIFPKADSLIDLNPSFEPSVKPRNEENEEIFSQLQTFRDSRLLIPVGEKHLYYAAIYSKQCKLTPLGQYFWHLVSEEKI
jgi:hypothetical protein